MQTGSPTSNTSTVPDSESVQDENTRIDRSAELVNLSLKAFEVQFLDDLFIGIIGEMRNLLRFNEADFILFADHSYQIDFWQTFNCEQEDGSVEYLKNVPIKIGNDPYAEIVTLEEPKIIVKNHWVGKYPSDNLLFKAETKFEFTCYIPFFKNNRIAALLKLKTNEVTDFNGEMMSFVVMLKKFLSPAIAGLQLRESKTVIKELPQQIAAFNLRIGTVKTKAELIEVIGENLRNIIGFDEVCVRLLNEDHQTHTNYIHYSNLPVPENFVEFKNAKFPLNDGIFNVTQASDSPIVWNISEVMRWKSVPAYIRFFSDNGIKRLAGFPIKINNRKVGGMYFASEDIRAFQPADLTHIREMSFQLSSALGNIVEAEAAEKIEADKNMLLTLSKAISDIRDQPGLFRFIEEHLKSAFKFNDLIVCIINPDGGTHHTFIRYLEEERKIRPGFERMLELGKCTISDGIINTTIGVGGPVIWDIDEIMQWTDVPDYIKFWSENKMKRFINAPLYNDKVVVGSVFYYSKDENAFDNDSLIQVSAITQLLSIAFFNILANEEIKKRDEEKDFMCSLGNNIAGVKTQKQMIELLHIEFKNLNFFNDAVIFTLEDDNLTFSAQPINSGPGFSGHAKSGWPASDRNLQPVNDGFLDQQLARFNSTEFELTDLLQLEQTPKYLRAWSKQGVKRIALAPLFKGTSISGFLFLLSKSQNQFFEPHYYLIDCIAYLLSSTASNIAVSEAIELRDKEQDALLSVSNGIAETRNKKDLINYVLDKLKILLPFNDLRITYADKKEHLHSGFIHYYEKRRTDDSEFDYVMAQTCPDDEYTIRTTMSSDDPVIFKLDDLMNRDDKVYYYPLFHRNGIKELIGAPLRNGKQEIGAMWYTSEEDGRFKPHHLHLMKGIASMMTTAVANILANEEIDKHNLEKSLLLDLSNNIATIRDQKQLLSVVHDKINKLIPFDDILITLIDQENGTHSVFLNSTSSQLSAHPNFSAISGSASPFGKEVIKKILKTRNPIVFNVKSLGAQPEKPAYITFYQEMGIKEFVGVAMQNGDLTLGSLFISSNRENTYQEKDFNMIRGIADQLSFATVNIIANEEILQREREKSILMAISNDMSAIRNKSDVLRVLHERLRNIFYFSHIMTTLSDNVRQTYSGYIFDPKSKSRNHADYNKNVRANYPITAAFMQRAVFSKEPVAFDLDELIQQPDVPAWVTMNYECGIREMVIVSLDAGDKHIGTLCIYTEEKNKILPKQQSLLQGISYQLSNAVANILANEEISQKENEKSTLLTLSSDVATIRNKFDLHKVVNDKLKKLLPISHILTCLISEDGMHYSPYILDPESKCKKHPDYAEAISGMCNVNDGIVDLVLHSDQPVVYDLDEIAKRPNIPLYLKINHECGIREVVYAALNNGKRRAGVLAIFMNSKNNTDDNNLNLIRGIAAQLSTAISNIMANDEIIEREDEKSLLLQFSKDIAAVRDKNGLSAVISQGLKDLFKVKDYLLSVISEDQKTHSYYLFDMAAIYTKTPAFEKIKTNKYTIQGGMAQAVFEADGPINFVLDDLAKNKKINFPNIEFWKSVGVDEILGVPLRVGSKDVGLLWMHPNQTNERLLKGISSQIGIALANTIANEKIEKQLEEINKYRQQLEVENLYLQEEIQTTHNYSEIIGSSAVMRDVFHLVSQVSDSTSSVLILGETGTGKELIARAIHNASSRKDKLMVKVNCATLPANLIESELFGHERGSFTGATEKRIGKFELANHSTLFLDEVGELPLELQVKLLRALQEKEIERVGGRTVIKTDVRIIAATNRNLQKEVLTGNFRSDLYYRLEVFPITIPPLRERKEDIPVLASHFLTKHAKKSKGSVVNFSSKVIKQLSAYNWPGNVRELEHMIERSILLASGSTITQINLPTVDSEEESEEMAAIRLKTLDENERDHIMEVLKACNGKVAGIGGAAEILKLPSTTLNSKIRKHRIKKNYLKDN